MMKRFEGKVVLVTGGNRNTGLDIVERFVRDGAKVYMCGSSAASTERGAAILASRGVEGVVSQACDISDIVQVAELFDKAGFMILATRGTYSTLMDAGIPAALVRKMSEGRPNIVDLIINGRIDLIVNTPGHGEVSNKDGGSIRTAAIKAHLPYMTTMAAAKASAVGILEEQAIEAVAGGAVLPVKSLEEYAATRK